MQDYINFGFNIESFAYILTIVISGTVIVLFLKLDWKRYGLLFLISGFVANVLCFIFVAFDFYFFPYVFFPNITNMPIDAVTLTFSMLVLIGVRYSPEKWGWKIPFYWVIIHIGMLLETVAINYTQIMKYNYKWDFWDSYTWWWIYLLIFQWLGDLLIPHELRKPIDFRHLQYGKIGWAIIHFVLIITIFLGGYYLGRLK
ncbi:CBO0543 family protein [Virgibacillus sp. DJP39]|uniref:CBO0543 family protein n=1 Tax=Virgibacillus sp. DJP39 TaxID=3409790 RepID=UPI003BB501CB